MSSAFLRFVCFVTLVDREVLESCSLYDKLLVAASFLRQIVSFAFVFLVFWYAWSSVFPIWMAFLTALVLALVVFSLDQAIIGTEWSLQKGVSSRVTLSAIASFGLRILHLLPRVAYAVVIALFIATLAEVALQSKAIDRILREESKAANKEYFDRINERRQSHADAIAVLDQRIEREERAVETVTDPTVAETKIRLEQEASALLTAVEMHTSMSSASATALRKSEADLVPLRVAAARLQAAIRLLQEQMAAEEREGRCLNPGSPDCRGERWSRFNSEKIRSEIEHAELLPKISALETRREELTEELTAANANLASARSAHAATLEKTRALSGDGRDLETLRAELSTLKQQRATLEAEHVTELTDLSEALIAAGYFSAADYDLLDRYVGLQKLHAHPVRGEAARRGSFGLKIIIVLVELAPVLVSVIFMPFSFYATRMRERRDNELRDVDLARLEREEALSTARAAHALANAERETDLTKKLVALRLERRTSKAEAAFRYRAAKGSMGRRTVRETTESLDMQQDEMTKVRNRIEIQKLINELQELEHEHQMKEELTASNDANFSAVRAAE